jgi:ABC-2 type transport system permease protein
MGHRSALGGVARYEFTMQVRRPTLWVGMGLLAALLYVGSYNSLLEDPLRGKVLTHHDDMLYWAWSTVGILTIGAGLLLADRFARDRRTHVDELLGANPVGSGTHLAGKYLGSVLATLTPIALIYGLGAVFLAARWGDIGVLPLAAAAFLLLVVPPTFFVGAFSIACTTVLWPPLYMFLFVGYWFWASLGSDVPIPTLGGTYLSPIEDDVINGIFHFGRYQHVTVANPTATVLQGIVNIAVLLTCGAIALTAARGLLRWRANQQ